MAAYVTQYVWESCDQFAADSAQRFCFAGKVKGAGAGLGRNRKPTSHGTNIVARGADQSGASVVAHHLA
jgi:hypothetical protein